MTKDKPEEGTTLIQKLAQVMAEIERVPKRGENTFHHYRYATEADILAAIRGSLAKAGVMMIPSILAHERVAVDRGWATTIHLEIIFCDNDSAVKISWFGVAEDTGDKGLWKAITGAIKYVLLKTFLIPTGDDPEADDVDESVREMKKGVTPIRTVADQAAVDGQPLEVPRQPTTEEGQVYVTAAFPRKGRGPAKFRLSTGETVATFTAALIEPLTRSLREGLPVRVTTKETKWGLDVTGVSLGGPQQSSLPEPGNDSMPF